MSPKIANQTKICFYAENESRILIEKNVPLDVKVGILNATFFSKKIPAFISAHFLMFFGWEWFFRLTLKTCFYLIAIRYIAHSSTTPRTRAKSSELSDLNFPEYKSTEIFLLNRFDISHRVWPRQEPKRNHLNFRIWTFRSLNPPRCFIHNRYDISHTVRLRQEPETNHLNFRTPCTIIRMGCDYT